MSKIDFGVYIGRFQPLHIGHEFVIREALGQVETLIIVIGSSFQARTPINPFSFEERKQMIALEFPYEVAERRIQFVPMLDHPSDDDWAEAVRDTVNDTVNEHRRKTNADLSVLAQIALAGFGKDASSFYLDMFPGWGSIQITTQHGTINASDIRHEYLRRLPRYNDFAISSRVLSWLRGFALTPEFKELVAEVEYYAKAQAEYGKGPFLTADALVKFQDHVLLVTRGKTPGRGLLAMPGGFVNPDELLFRASLRELEEETGLILTLEDIGGVIMADNPKRSLRGRVVSSVCMFDISFRDEMPAVKGADDAAHAGWYRFEDLRPEQFFEDHYFIINEIMGA